MIRLQAHIYNGGVIASWQFSAGVDILISMGKGTYI
jgi:hypothetical protein